MEKKKRNITRTPKLIDFLWEKKKTKIVPSKLIFVLHQAMWCVISLAASVAFYGKSFSFRYFDQNISMYCISFSGMLFRFLHAFQTITLVLIDEIKHTIQFSHVLCYESPPSQFYAPFCLLELPEKKPLFSSQM